MRGEEFYRLIKLSYDHVGKYGRDGARIYHAVVALDRLYLLWRKRAEDLGWQEPPVDEPSSDQ